MKTTVLAAVNLADSTKVCVSTHVQLVSIPVKDNATVHVSNVTLLVCLVTVVLGIIVILVWTDYSFSKIPVSQLAHPVTMLMLTLVTVKLVTIPVTLVMLVNLTIVILVILQDTYSKTDVKPHVQMEPIVSTKTEPVLIVTDPVKLVTVEMTTIVLLVMPITTYGKEVVFLHVQVVLSITKLPVNTASNHVLPVSMKVTNVLLVLKTSSYTELPV